MTRAPFNVLVYPYRWVGEAELEYVLLKRSDAGFWQGVSGGGEDDETPLAAAKRETFEETGIPAESQFLQLDTIEYIPVIEFKDSYLWGEGVYVIPQYCFGVLAEDQELLLSHEHTEYCWLEYEQALARLRFDGNKTALWELDQRLMKRKSR